MDFFQSRTGHFAMYFQATSGSPGPQNSCSFAKARMQKVLAEFLVLDQDRGSVSFSPENMGARAEARLQIGNICVSMANMVKNHEFFPNVGTLGEPNLETI